MKLLKKCVKMLIFNSWIKTAFLLMICFGFTYLILSNFSELFVQTFNWRSKNFWTAIAILIPTMCLFPTFLNMLLFAKIVQTSDNTNKTSKLMQSHVTLTQQLLDNTCKNNDLTQQLLDNICKNNDLTRQLLDSAYKNNEMLQLHLNLIQQSLNHKEKN